MTPAGQRAGSGPRPDAVADGTPVTIGHEMPYGGPDMAPGGAAFRCPAERAEASPGRSAGGQFGCNRPVGALAGGRPAQSSELFIARAGDTGPRRA